MIQEIKLYNIATYTNPVIMRPLKLNFCYGSNGSGKTILAKLISKNCAASDCHVFWDNGELPVLVYNKDFVGANFSEKIGGIFTLGDDSKEAQEFIANKRKEVQACALEIENLSGSKENLKTEQEQANSAFDDACWAVQQTYGARFSEALVGYRGSKRAFSKKCLEEYPQMDEDEPPNIKGIEELYNASYSDKKAKYTLISKISVEEIIANEECSLLGKRISGSAETPVGQFIEYLQNSDWVKQGIGYVSRSNGKCPYCQQLLPAGIQQSIEEFFDDIYEKECAAVQAFEGKYLIFTDTLLTNLSAIVNEQIPILSYELFDSELSTLTKTVESNKKTIAEKLKSPGTQQSIDSLVPIVNKLNDLIKGFNEKITHNNSIVNDQEKNRKQCQNLIWQFFTYELRETIKQYNKKQNGIDKGIKNLDEKINAQKEKRKALNKEIIEKEKTLTSVAPTVNAINGILKRFGFTGFELSENAGEKGTYKIIRPDGSDAKKTLSEGEHNFIAFLYFYHLVYGSLDRTGIAKDKVVIIDDPISSLDSNVLFIITTLVRDLLRDCMNQKNGIKQIFVLTHNVYFHKEITFRGSRAQYPTTVTAYWIIKKKDNVSDIVRYDKNPIQTSYELLWTELKDTEGTQRVTVFNTLRRILEYYFNVIGGLDYEKCIDQFDGQDQIICKALISSINDGSHFISDDFVMCYESDSLENYLRVFKLIFEKMGHDSHYQMMMRESSELYAGADAQNSETEEEING